MTTKTKTMKVSYPHINPNVRPGDPDQWRYRVEQVTDSTSPTVREFLLKKEVDEYCAARDWKVTIIPQ